MVDFRRTHDCGSLCQKDVGANVKLSGWVHRYRDHGGLIFIDLRDRYGITQLVFNPDLHPDAHQAAERLRHEWVVTVKGEVIPRRPGMVNSKLPTGEIEVSVDEVHVLSTAQTPPFSVCDERIDVNEELRLHYRYLDIRRGEIAKNLVLRHKAMMATRHYLDKHGFLEINTPILGKSTPEGARDYLVPSRVYPGCFYALPQSPQLFKQLLMVAGMDRYFQIAPCFRDEDLRSDRQPEFTQIDIEMSFGTVEELFPIIEKLMAHIFNECLGIVVPMPFRRMSYATCMEKYGTDKPDLRFGMELHNLSDIAGGSSFTTFLEQIQAGNDVKGLCVKGGADISRKEIDVYTSLVGTFGIAGLAWMKCQGGQLTSNIVKFFPDVVQKELMSRLAVEDGDLLFMVAEAKGPMNQALDHLRRRIAKDRGLVDPSKTEFVWVTDFPLFTWNAQDKRIESEHHPFTSPHFDDLHLLKTDPLSARSLSYDLVLNGYEIASGSQRIHNGELQQTMFELLRLSPEEIKNRFGFFVEALGYGTPPHLGAALGLDRVMMIMTQTDNIRDVIAFPKTQRASDLMMQSPSEVARDQLTDLHIFVTAETA